ncbi:MAG: tetratricopeptide repeat protein [Anaerolineae bacterium]|jgi:tetratricopeptide (TPR) repeat protein
MMTRRKPGLDRFRQTDNGRKEAEIHLEAGRMMVRQGAIEEARRLFRAAIDVDPSCADAWVQLARLADDPAGRRKMLQHVVALEPDNTRARAELARLEQPARPQRGGSRLRTWLLGLLVLAAGLLAAGLIWGPVDVSLARLLPTATPAPSPTPTLTPGQIVARFVPQLEAALADEAWGRALEIVAIVQGVDAQDRQVRHWTTATHLQYGQALVRDREVGQALAQFEQAAASAPDDPQPLRWQQASLAYLAGVDARAGGDLAAAVAAFLQAYELLPEFGDVESQLVDAFQRQGEAALEVDDWTAAIQSLSDGHGRFPDEAVLTDLLAAAYRGRGISWQAEGKLQKARTDLESALALRPDDAEAQAHYDEVMYILFPPKRIEINITTQRFYAWKGDTLIYEFPTSTGLRGRDTAPGHYEVLDKIPMAYSSVWNLQMPYWLGIYYVGGIENGIHALPIRPDGSIMWAGLLGQRASYGCVILDTEAARLIYNWAEVGTEVHIHY